MSGSAPGADRAALLVLAGAAVITNVGLRLLTDVGPFARIALSLVVGVAVSAVIVSVLTRRRD